MQWITVCAIHLIEIYPVDSVIHLLNNRGLVWAIPHLFERLFLISWENNRDCHITMPLSLKTMEVQIKGDQ